MGLITDSSQLASGVEFPGEMIDTSAEDLAAPLLTLLIDLGVNPKPEDTGSSGSGNDTPASVAIIEAGATELTKRTKAWLLTIGGVSGVAGLAGGFVDQRWNNVGDGVRVTLVAGAGAVVVAAVLAVAIMVAADVRGRAHGAMAQYRARADIARAFLESAVALNASTDSSARGASSPSRDGQTVGSPFAFEKELALFAAALEGHAWAVVRGGQEHRIVGLQLNEATRRIELRLGDDSTCHVEDILSFASPSTRGE